MTLFCVKAQRGLDFSLSGRARDVESGRIRARRRFRGGVACPGLGPATTAPPGSRGVGDLPGQRGAGVRPGGLAEEGLPRGGGTGYAKRGTDGGAL